jgi:hypothetical protein
MRQLGVKHHVVAAWLCHQRGGEGLRHFKGPVSLDCEGFFIIHYIKSVLSVWTLAVFEIFYSEMILIFKDEFLMYFAQNAS